MKLTSKIKFPKLQTNKFVKKYKVKDIKNRILKSFNDLKLATHYAKSRALTEDIYTAVYDKKDTELFVYDPEMLK